jgi:pimeloyl-ACP methyl ester carboxylesterase
MKVKWMIFALSMLLASCGTPHDDQPSSPQSSDSLEDHSGYFSSDGLQIFYRVVGKGHPMVLVHGWGTNGEINWEKTGWVEKLRSHRKLIILDVRGHGKSDKPYDQKVYSYSTMAHDVLGVMDHLAIEKADFIGYSMGSFMGAYLLGHYPERFTTMVLGGIGDETKLSADLSYAIAAALRVGKVIGDYFHVSDPHFDLESLALSCLQMWPEGYPRQLGGPGLLQTKTPVLVINGAADKPYVDTDEDLIKVIPRAQLIRIPGKNHLTTFQDKRFFPAVSHWLQQHSTL